LTNSLIVCVFSRYNKKIEEFMLLFKITLDLAYGGVMMKIHIPKFAFRHTQDAENRDTTIAFGGLPVGLPEEKWPVCSECETPLSFLFQMQHHPERLPLGKEGRILYLFQCENGGECSTWELEGGCNQVLILEPEEITATTAPHPDEDTLILP